MEATSNQNRPAKRRTARRAALSLVAVALVGLSLAACSSGGSSDPSATSAASGSSSDAASNADAQFTQCVQQHGVPQFQGAQNGHFIISSSVEDNPNFSSAIQACEHYLPSGSIGGNSQNSSAELNFAHCMQTHGVPSWPDPTANGAMQAPQGVDINSPTVQQAEQQCESDLPGGGQGFRS